MNKLEKSIAEAMMQEDFSIIVRNAGVFRFPSAYRFESHNHREIEISYINNGSCIMEINDTFIPLKRGDCIVVYPGEKHLFIVDARENCRVTQLEFELEISDEIRDRLAIFQTDQTHQKITGCESVCPFMENLCRIFRSENEGEGKDAMLHLGFFQLFIDLSEKLLKEKQSIQRAGKAGKITEIISYINENFEKNMNMEVLAKRFGVSSRYIRKCFQEETGMNCQKYITTLRISKAKELLWFTDKTATEIAHETGFGSSQYFCRVFLQHTEMTPLEYRNMWFGQIAEEVPMVDMEK